MAEKTQAIKKAQIIDKVSETSSLSKKDVTTVLECVLDCLSETLANGDSVVFTGFGTFSVKERSARMGRNLQTGEPMQIAAVKVPHFKAGKGLKDLVNEK